MRGRAVFSEGDAARPITASQPPGAHARLANITGQGWRGRTSLSHVLTNRDRPAIASDVHLAPESTNKIVDRGKPAEVGYSLEVPNDDAWFHAGVTQRLGAKKDVLLCFATWMILCGNSSCRKVFRDYSSWP
jgi:hypothetical protein